MPNNTLADAIRAVMQADVEAATIPGLMSDPGAVNVGGVSMVPDWIHRLMLGDPTGLAVQLEGFDAEARGQSWARQRTTYPGLYDFLLEAITTILSQESKLPTLSLLADRKVTVAKTQHDGISNIRLKFQDGYIRDAVPITIDLDISGEGGLDAGTVATDTWYYLYLVPETADDTSMLGIASLITPSGGGPAGYANYRYLGAVRTYTNVGTKILPFQHRGSRFWYRERQNIWTAGAVAPGLRTVSLAARVPTTGVSVNLEGRIQRALDGSSNTDQLKIGAVGTEFFSVLAYAKGSGDDDTSRSELPIDSQSFRLDIVTSSSNNPVSSDVWVLGWYDSFV